MCALQESKFETEPYSKGGTNERVKLKMKNEHKSILINTFIFKMKKSHLGIQNSICATSGNTLLCSVCV